MTNYLREIQTVTSQNENLYKTSVENFRYSTLGKLIKEAAYKGKRCVYIFDQSIRQQIDIAKQLGFHCQETNQYNEISFTITW